MSTLTSGGVDSLPSSMYRLYNRIPQSKLMHIMPRGHMETDPSIFSYFITLCLEYAKVPRLIWILAQWQGIIVTFSFLEAIRYPKYINIAHTMVEFWK